MKIQLFKNRKGLIYGADAKRISCDKEGILKVASTEINISPGAESIVPLLYNGCNGELQATFTDKNGNVYELDKVNIRGGRIVPPSQTTLDQMELRCRVDELETVCETMQEQIRDLANIFDTNSLNFLIK